MEKKTAVYICTGHGIGDVLDVEKLGKVASGEFKVPIVRTHESVGGPEIREMIQNDIDNEGVNCVVVAGASPRAMTDVFDFTGVLVERVNLREGVVWSRLDDADPEDLQMMAEDYLRMGLVKVGKSELPAGYLGPNGADTQWSREILVVGGGVAGMTAALDVAKAGYKAVIVEKEAVLGGNSLKWKLSTPTKPPYKELEDTGVAALAAEVEANDNITVHASSKIEQIAGAPGLFDTTIKSNGSDVTARFGAVVLATGWVPYDASKLGHLGYGASPDVVTNVQLEEMASAGPINRPSDGSAPMAVAFIQCAGSRDQEHLPYCSAVCCRASLKHALYLKEQNEEMAVYIIYKDVRAPGQDEELYRMAQRAGVVFIKGDVTDVKANGGKLTVEADDVLLGDKVELEELDMVVLATGMVPTTRLGENIKPAAAVAEAKDEAAAPAEAKAEEAPKEEKKKKKKKGKKGKKEEAKPAKEAEAPLPVPVDVIYASDILNLTYRQGPELPDLKYGFPDSHYICFPYESRRTGIYPAGCVRRPMTMSTAKEDATGAAMKAIQCIESVVQGQAVHPRSGDLSFPEIYLSRCTQCRRCTDECPFGAYNEDEKSNPVPYPTRCRRCGICMGACPERVISFKNYSVDMIGSMIKKIDIPESDEDKPRVLIFACENDSYPALDMAAMNGMGYSPYVRIISLRCLGSLNLVWIADALASGFDGVMLLGCRHGDDYQCHFIRGSELATIRMSKITETLTRLQLEPERIRVEEVGITDWPKVPKLIAEFMETIDRVGPNPFKDL